MPESNVGIPMPKMTETGSLARWPVAVAIGLATLMAVGAVIAITRPQMLAPTGQPITDAARVYAGYLVSRNGAVALLLGASAVMRAREALSNFLVLSALIQFLDSIVDCFEGRWPLVPGILLIGVVSLTAATRLSGRPFWKRSF